MNKQQVLQKQQQLQQQLQQGAADTHNDNSGRLSVDIESLKSTLREVMKTGVHVETKSDCV